MPRFDTPAPVSLTLHVAVGTTRIAASGLPESTVAVHPGDPDREADVKAADQTRVSYADGRLLVATPKGRGLFSRPGSVSVEITLPEGSEVHGTASMGDFTCTGRLGDCRLKSSAGDILVARADAVHAVTQYGDVAVEYAAGSAQLTTASGALRAGELGGSAELKNSNGTTRVDEARGELRLKVANGDISIGRAHASVTARSANGAIRIAEAVRGALELDTSAGDLQVGVREGTAVWLDADSKAGQVRSSLESVGGPGEAAETLAVRARTSLGDIDIFRAGRD
ncbi:DUF4097 family beta strand repeat-containing protein [Streptomyces boncukensis]|uniref:DUF4097 domain-containing protein n=1 Tax=Streptomyces boncukensis TaxID=2711219 RepID=A0A6G4WUR7_9ACTN|nr:DUF4097 family beta strand repeat-containing protein [Streptomyces boncukensis]NGO68858.1 DUF4097 domain-containing protein [Streptomyces boncukensis]